jgi:hypothetical protein
MAQQLTPNDMPMRGPRALRARYSELFPACQTDGCHDIADGLDGRYCGKCHSDREWSQRRTTASAAR